MRRIEELLLRMVGFHPDAIGRGVLERAVAGRMRTCGAPTLDAYHAVLLGSEAELQDLIEDVVVPETWFFRDPAAFAALAEWAAREWMPAHPAGTLRLLSLPCSTGEEPYTMAMALLDAGLPAERLRIDAVDISARALALAAAGLYRKSAFRTSELRFRDRYFQPEGGGYRIAAPVRNIVSFRHGNLHDPGFVPPRGEYDVVFCRNLLIYLDAAVQKKAVDRLTSIVVDDGLFFVGAAETYLMRGRGFSPIGRPMSFAFRRAGVESPRRGSTGNRPPRRPAARPATWPTRRSDLPAPPVEPAVPEILDRAERLADEGRLAEAKELGEAAIRERGPSARAHHILGVVCGAQGHLEAAAQHLRQALYLDPYHEATLLHLALLAIQSGRGAEAERLLERARRAGERSNRPVGTGAVESDRG